MDLSDEAKIGKFIEAFEMNQEFFEGKIVLNVGCGHGLLSMLAAKVGQSSIKTFQCEAFISDFY